MQHQISQPPKFSSLDIMFTMQRALVEWYMKMENLPNYPLDLTMRKSQEILKKFAYRVIEELSEAYANLMFAFQAIQTNHSDEAAEAIEKYNEELADVWHFMLETMIFSGIDEDWVYNWTVKYLENNKQYDGLMNSKNLLGGFLKYSEFMNSQDGLPYVRKDRTIFVVISEADAIEQPWNMGGRRLSNKIMDDHNQFLWFITHKLTIAMNCLKIRDWQKGEGMAVNIISYNEYLMEAFIGLIRLMSYTGKTELSIYNSYLIKNKINREKQTLV